MSQTFVIIKEDETFVIAAGGEQGPPGTPGPPGPGGQTYIHTQAVESDTWTVNHNLNIRPSVTVFDATGTPVNAGVAHTNANQSIITFVVPLTGSVRCV